MCRYAMVSYKPHYACLIVGKPLKEGFFMTSEKAGRMISPNALNVANLWRIWD